MSNRKSRAVPLLYETKTDVARKRIASFRARFTEGHLFLAYHAAFPLALTPDLLYRLWNNFQRDIHQNKQDIPREAVADLLLSPLCKEVGYELYQMDADVRSILLSDLKANHDLGEDRINDLARFLLKYIQQQTHTDPDLAQAQKLVALSHVEPIQAAHELAASIREEALAILKQPQDNMGQGAEMLRMGSLLNTLIEPLTDEQQTKFTPLLTYVEGMTHFVRGDVTRAADQLGKIAEGMVIQVLGEQLPVPGQVQVEIQKRQGTADETEVADASQRNVFRPLPPPTGQPPYHLSLESVWPPKQMQIIRTAGRLVFHMAGNTGGVMNRSYQKIVSMKMQEGFNVADPAARPSFFYILGGVVFYNGSASHYYAQFYDPYRSYPAPIFAIPGYSDGIGSDDSIPSLDGFVRNFCAAKHERTLEAGDAQRLTMTQPNVYWTLDAPFVTIVGLYTNVVSGGQLDDNQIAWLESELASAPVDKALILTMRHTPYSFDTHGGSVYMSQVLDNAMQRTGRIPDAVFCGKVKNYQRFTRSLNGRDVPYIIAGAGGYPNLQSMMRPQGQVLSTPLQGNREDVTLEAYCDDRHGFLRLEVTAQTLKGEYYTVPRLDEPWSNKAELKDSFTLDLKAHHVSTRATGTENVHQLAERAAVLVNEGIALAELKRYEEALAAYDRAIGLNPKDARAYSNKGTALVELKRYEEAIIACDQALDLDPNNATTYTNKGIALVNLKRYVEALAACDQALDLDPNNATTYTSKGIALVNLKRYVEALAAFDHAHLLNPKDVIAYSNKGTALINLKQYEEALVACDQALHIDPNYAPAYNNKGVALSGLKRYEKALVAYDQALHLEPKDALAYHNKGAALINLKRYEEALAACDQALGLNPKDVIAYSNKGTALVELKRYEEAIIACDQALDLDPNDATSYTNKGIALVNLKRYREARMACDQALALNPKNATAYTTKGIALVQLKRYKDALVACDQAHSLNPKDVIAYTCKSAALSGLKRYLEALEASDQALHIDPNYAPAHNNEGVALFNLKRYEEAIAAYDQALHLEPEDALAYHNKVLALQRLGRKRDVQ